VIPTFQPLQSWLSHFFIKRKNILYFTKLKTPPKQKILCTPNAHELILNFNELIWIIKNNIKLTRIELVVNKSNLNHLVDFLDNNSCNKYWLYFHPQSFISLITSIRYISSMYSTYHYLLTIVVCIVLQ